MVFRMCRGKFPCDVSTTFHCFMKWGEEKASSDIFCADNKKQLPKHFFFQHEDGLRLQPLLKSANTTYMQLLIKYEMHGNNSTTIQSFSKVKLEESVVKEGLLEAGGYELQSVNGSNDHCAVLSLASSHVFYKVQLK